MDTWINVETGLISPFIRCEKKLMWLPIPYQIKVLKETYIFLSCPWNSRYFWRSFPWKQRVQKISLYKYRDNTYIYQRIYMKEYITGEKLIVTIILNAELTALMLWRVSELFASAAIEKHRLWSVSRYQAPQTHKALTLYGLDVLDTTINRRIYQKEKDKLYS